MTGGRSKALSLKSGSATPMGFIAIRVIGPDRATAPFKALAAHPYPATAHTRSGPFAYPGRTPHIHFRIDAPARRLTTQMYVAGEPLNDGDIIYRSLDRAGRNAVTVLLVAANGIEDGALAGEFNIVV